MPELSNWKAVFLAELAASPNVARATRCAGVDPTTPYKARQVDPEFAAGWQRVENASVEDLQASAFKRAIESDTLTIFLLKCHMKEIYGEKRESAPPESPTVIVNVNPTERGSRGLDAIDGGPDEPPS
jgi:hypothetical protein